MQDINYHWERKKSEKRDIYIQCNLVWSHHLIILLKTVIPTKVTWFIVTGLSLCIPPLSLSLSTLLYSGGWPWTPLGLHFSVSEYWDYKCMLVPYYWDIELVSNSLPLTLSLSLVCVYVCSCPFFVSEIKSWPPAILLLFRELFQLIWVYCVSGWSFRFLSFSFFPLFYRTVDWLWKNGQPWP